MCVSLCRARLKNVPASQAGNLNLTATNKTAKQARWSEKDASNRSFTKTKSSLVGRDLRGMTLWATDRRIVNVAGINIPLPQLGLR